MRPKLVAIAGRSSRRLKVLSKDLIWSLNCHQFALLVPAIYCENNLKNQNILKTEYDFKKLRPPNGHWP